ncbi:unnamed protein product, partial [Ixodes persulcatus]
ICPFRHCECSKCSLVTMRRQILAEEASIQKKEQAESTLMEAGAIYNERQLDVCLFSLFVLDFLRIEY